MDALIMEGTHMKAGAVGAVHAVRNPITLARKVMEQMTVMFINNHETGHLTRADVENPEKMRQIVERHLGFMEEPEWRADVKLRGERRLAAQLTEFWWGRCLNEVRIRSKTEGKMSGSRGFVAFGGVVIPEEVADVLNKGPKYSYEPTVSAHDLLALNRSVSNKAGQEAQERCLLEGSRSPQENGEHEGHQGRKGPHKKSRLVLRGK
ncbi:hypothetical protein HPB50_025934 [Hyalomma asiaticum]|uniref:Uncharacterized protein n=1 Tax=Hyalomma asiaticum TaxID=266040 RepID=A0ACB7S3G5_HYAAI|nr:hypothetical protein HPB50_025934 [Hyalomma asiaticum]